MIIATNKATFKNATIQQIGKIFLVTIGTTRKIYDNKTTATNYITSLGYQF